MPRCPNFPDLGGGKTGISFRLHPDPPTRRDLTRSSWLDPLSEVGFFRGRRPPNHRWFRHGHPEPRYRRLRRWTLSPLMHARREDSLILQENHSTKTTTATESHPRVLQERSENPP